MADNFDFPGPDEPHPAPPPEGDLPADFFDDAAEPSPFAGLSGPEAVPPPPDEPVGWEPPAAGEPVPAPAPTPAPAGAPVPAAEAAAGAPVLRNVLAWVMVAVLLVAVVASKLMRKEAPAAASGPEAEPSAPAPAPNPALARSVDALKTRVDGLAADLKGLTEMIDGLPEPAPPADLAPVNGRLDELSKSVAALSELPKRVEGLDAKLGDLDGAVKKAREATDGLTDDVKKATESATAASAAVARLESTPRPEPAAENEQPPAPQPDASAAALEEGRTLFQAGKYKEAAEIFKKLQADPPRDARFYYYAALANGMATRDWQNETLALASKGAELEKSGATSPEDVDAAFRGLPATLKPWLDFFRKSARP